MYDTGNIMRKRLVIHKYCYKMVINVRKNRLPTHTTLNKQIPDGSMQKQHLKTFNGKFKIIFFNIRADKYFLNETQKHKP